MFIYIFTHLFTLIDYLLIKTSINLPDGDFIIKVKMQKIFIFWQTLYDYLICGCRIHSRDVNKFTLVCPLHFWIIFWNLS